MSNWILLLLLLFQWALSYAFHKRNFCPSYILILAMLIPTLMVIFMHSYIEYDLSFETIILIVSLVFSFQIGEMIISTAGGSLREKTYKCSYMIINSKFKYLPIAIQIINMIVMYRYFMEVGAQYGAEDFVSAFAANSLNAIKMQKDGDVEVTPSFVNYLTSNLATSVNVICLHVAMVQKIVWHQKISKWIVWAIVLFFVSFLFESRRATLVSVLVHLFYLFIILKHIPFSKFIKKYCVKLFLISCVIAIFFIAVGSLRDKKNIKESEEIEMVSTKDMLAMYIASPIIGLDIYLKKGAMEYPNFGEHTFKSLYNIIRKIGINFERPPIHEENFVIKNLEANVSTGFSYWIKDFSLFGAFVYSFIIGFVFGFIHLLEKKKYIRLDNIIGVYFISICYWALMMVYFNNTLRTIFTIDFYFNLLLIYILIRLIVNKVYPTKLNLLNK